MEVNGKMEFGVEPTFSGPNESIGLVTHTVVIFSVGVVKLNRPEN